MGNTTTPKSAIETHYETLQTKCLEIRQVSFQCDDIAQFNTAHAFIQDYESWLNVLEGKLEKTILEAAIREYQYSLLAVVQGQYRHAYSSLRLFLELSLGAVYLSTNELELRTWLSNRRDLQWSAIVGENGIFAKRFIQAFCEELESLASNHHAIAVKVYRECSEFVHGNYHTHTLIPEHLKYQEKLFKDWLQKVESVILVISFCLCSRYIGSLSLEQKSKIENTIQSNLGHIEVIRILLSE